MSTEAAYEVARRALRLADERRWRELVQLVDADALAEHRERVLSIERLQQEHSRSMPKLEGMPEEVRRWHEEQHAKQGVTRHGIGNRFPGIASLEELEALSPAELLERQLSTRDPAHFASLMQSVAASMPSKDAPEPPEEHRTAIGIVSEDHVTAHVLYRTDEPRGTVSTRLHTLTLRLSPDGWRVIPTGEVFRSQGSFTMVRLGPVDGDTAALAPLPVEQTAWVERTFPTGLATGLLPSLLGRFEANLMRVMMMLGVPAAARTARPASGGWSIQEHAGHLLELERLGETRLSEFERGADVLSPADMSNRATVEADYNARSPQEIMEELWKLRGGMIRRIRELTPGQLAHSAMHPRLQQRMNVIDWLFFMCEHDDHHLARMRALSDDYWQRALKASE